MSVFAPYLLYDGKFFCVAQVTRVIIGADFVLRLTFKFPRNFFKFAFFSSRADW